MPNLIIIMIAGKLVNLVRILLNKRHGGSSSLCTVVALHAESDGFDPWDGSVILILWFWPFVCKI